MMLPPRYLSVAVLANKAHGSQNDTDCDSDRQKLVRRGSRPTKLDLKVNQDSLMLGLFGTVTKTNTAWTHCLFAFCAQEMPRLKDVVCSKPLKLHDRLLCHVVAGHESAFR